MLAVSAKHYSRKVALEFFGSETTYDDLYDPVRRVAQGLHKLGVKPGNRVALILPNCPQLVVAFYAALRLGAIVVEHNPLYTERELRHQFEDHTADVAIVWDAACDKVAEFPEDVRPSHIISVNITRAMRGFQQLALRLPIRKARTARNQLTTKPTAPNILSWRSIANHRHLSRRVHGPSLDDVALIQYTSGTTGVPKGAMLTHRNLRANAMQGQEWLPGLHTGHEVFYGVLPLFHAYGMTLCLTFALSIGARLVLFPAFDIGMIATAARKRPATFFPGVPPMYDRLVRAARDTNLNLSTVRFALSGAMALPVDTVTRWEECTGGLLIEGYGMTDSSPITLGNPAGPERQPGTIGIPFPSTNIRVVDPNDPTTILPFGSPGELLVQGPQVFKGYWNTPAETKKVLLKDGWLRTGDIVTVSDAGFVTVVDRIKELIITGGFNVSPTEVEGVLLQHPDVEDAAVIALPRGDGAEMVAAVVVLKNTERVEKHTDAELDAIRNYCRNRLAAYKVPRKIVVLNELPHSLVGKVVRRQVCEILLADGKA